MEKLAEKADLQLSEVRPDEDMRQNTWKPLVDFEGKWLGKICVYLGSAEEVDNLSKCFAVPPPCLRLLDALLRSIFDSSWKLVPFNFGSFWKPQGGWGRLGSSGEAMFCLTWRLEGF